MEELIIENYRIPWLIWIQLFVFFLLILLLFSFTLFPLDPDTDASAAATTVLPTASTSNHYEIIHHIDDDNNNKHPLDNHDSTTLTVVANRRHHSPEGQNLSIKGEIATSSSMRKEEITEEEASSLSFHPCHYFQLATVAFLKCFGLDSTSDNPPTQRRLKTKES
ncbi:hypothetical protein RIF29_11139 [Crotalaria pallida]|uniref:Transmembrane protein n=1 Tax=Crotalaria pallida TaxID=3830 RepID=A0AAN9ILU7_CROPI